MNAPFEAPQRNRLRRMSAPVFRERPAAGEATGLLVLHHGRGTDELDLLPLADALDPQQRLHVVTPRAPLTLPGWSGYHWYAVPRVGYPDPETFAASYELLGEFHDELWRRTGIGPERTVLGGFSMGCVMSYALALGERRPAPAGVLAFSGFIPSVEGWRAHFEDRRSLRALVRHGTEDPVIEISFGRAAREALLAGGLDVDYEEFYGGHSIPAAVLPGVEQWLAELIP
jgi:phospholipase/carboxylesterase